MIKLEKFCLFFNAILFAINNDVFNLLFYYLSKVIQVCYYMNFVSKLTKANFFIAILISLQNLYAQNVEKIYRSNIKTIQLFQYGNQQGIPVYNIDNPNKLELNFDDLDGGFKNYYYTFVLCDYNWKPSSLNSFDFIKGFIQNRITTYRFSTLAYKKYTHYQAFLPGQDGYPVKSGNYLLKVYLDGDTSKVVFTKQMLVVQQKAIISSEVVQPFSTQLFYTHQRLRFTVNNKVNNTFSAAQQFKVVILQNNRWDNAQRDIAPTYVRGNMLEYNSENIGVFPGGKEWRWLDIRSFRLYGDRVDNGVYNDNIAEFNLKNDIDRTTQQYIYFPDYNGSYNISTYESINPFWQADYAKFNFNFSPPDGIPYHNKDIYIAGAFSGYNLTDQWKMTYNSEKERYEGSAFLKQGYYNYTYILADKNDPSLKTDLEGNYWETENDYTILVYYKSFTDRNDQLIGVSTINSRKTAVARPMVN